jgi:hypothetical protein
MAAFTDCTLAIMLIVFLPEPLAKFNLIEDTITDFLRFSGEIRGKVGFKTGK